MKAADQPPQPTRTPQDRALYWAGQFIVYGLISLLLAMICALAAILLMGRPSGEVAETLAMIFGYAWLPLVAFGILGRLTNAKEQPSSSSAESPPPASSERDNTQ